MIKIRDLREYVFCWNGLEKLQLKFRKGYFLSVGDLNDLQRQGDPTAPQHARTIQEYFSVLSDSPVRTLGRQHDFRWNLTGDRYLR